MTDRAAIVSAARALIGTPYRHQGRVAGESGGVDCIGVPVLVARSVGLRPPEWDVRGYRRLPDGHSLLRGLRAQLGEEVSEDRVAPGDVLLLDWGRHPHHVAILGDYHFGGLSMIHADSTRLKVVEHRLEIRGTGRFVTAFQFPGVKNV